MTSRGERAPPLSDLPNDAHRIGFAGLLERELARPTSPASPARLAGIVAAAPRPIKRGSDLEPHVDHLPRLKLQQRPLDLQLRLAAWELKQLVPDLGVFGRLRQLVAHSTDAQAQIDGSGVVM